MNWEGVIQQHGTIQSVYGQQDLLADPIRAAVLNAKYGQQQGGGITRINCTVQRAVAYGDVKVSFNVSIECPQQENWIDFAAHVIFTKAKELTDDAFCSIVQDAVRLP
jgi:hypothetical protein